MLIIAAFVSFLPFALANPYQVRDSDVSYQSACRIIASSISSASAVYYPGSPNFINDTKHWVPSSSQLSTCSVEPGTVQDVSTIVKILGRLKTPFAIRSAGHATSPGLSSTLGVAISLVRLDSVVYDSKSNTVALGPGQPFDRVYKELEAYGVNVVGGRIVGVGVGGFVLGGGYSWLSNRHGMAIDSVTQFELVLPNGTITEVSATSAPDLFFGLKGGYNNFGIVTKITMQAFKQGLIWGGVISYSVDNINEVVAASAKFSASNTIRDGNLYIAFAADSNGVPFSAISMFYNGPTLPSGLFSDFLAIPHTSKDLKTRTYLDFVQKSSVFLLNSNRLRGSFGTVSIPKLTVPVLNEIVNQARHYGTPGVYKAAPLQRISFAVEPFISQSIVRTQVKTAFPHDVFASPFVIYYSWANASDDRAGFAAIKETQQAVTQAVIKDGQSLKGTTLYPNYALLGTSVKSMYGVNLPTLKSLRRKYDPTGVFLNAGGFKFV